MYLTKSFIFQVIIFCTVVYIISILILLSYLSSKTCYELNDKQEKHNQNRNLITVVVIEFEMFENDLMDTFISLCDISLIDQILVISKTAIYPPISAPLSPTPTQLKHCGIRFITSEPDVTKSMIETHVHHYIGTDYVLIVPDSVRIESQNIIYRLINTINAMADNRVAIVVPVVDVVNNDSLCSAIRFDVKKWTLSYSYVEHWERNSRSCDSFDGQNAIFIKKLDLFALNQPFMRPFLHSFFIQSKIHSLRLKQSDVVLAKGKSLFALNARNQWKHEILTKERLKNLYKTFGIKKVIDLNGNVEWFGCTKSSNRCFGTVFDDMPDYLYANRWTPPCCLKNLAKTARHVFETLEKYGIRYWLEGGSLLGAKRNGQIIPYDFDVDIGVYRQDIHKCFYFNNTPTIDEKGFLWEKASEGDFYRVHYSPSNRLHVDIFMFYSRNGTMTKNTWFESHPQDKEFPEHYLKPLTKIRFVDWDAFAPNNIDNFLEFKFGKNVVSNPQYPNPNLLNFNKSDLDLYN